jgi:WD40 repeat protein
MARTGEFIKRIGSGYFSRGICAVCFSCDSLYVCAIGCDDHHSLGIWEISTGNLISESKASNGIPPQISSLAWSPEMPANAFVTTGQYLLIHL